MSAAEELAALGLEPVVRRVWSAGRRRGRGPRDRRGVADGRGLDPFGGEGVAAGSVLGGAAARRRSDRVGRGGGSRRGRSCRGRVPARRDRGAGGCRRGGRRRASGGARGALRRATDVVAGRVHLSLVLTGGNVDGLGAATLFDLPFASYAFDLIAGPENWRLIAEAPGDRGHRLRRARPGRHRRRPPRAARLGRPLRGVDARPRAGTGGPGERVEPRVAAARPGHPQAGGPRRGRPTRVNRGPARAGGEHRPAGGRRTLRGTGSVPSAERTIASRSASRLNDFRQRAQVRATCRALV